MPQRIDSCATHRALVVVKANAAAALATTLCLVVSPASYAAGADTDLADLSLEQLSAIKVTSVSRRAEPLATAAASIYVITNEAIRRAGAQTLPEALRLAPNLQVARLNGSQYAISARGFNSTAANKLLVQIDGRSLYTPLFSGVLWDVPDLVLADVDRIEVVSGAGATLWGSNAVNGIINIITRRAADTQGALVSASTGDGQHHMTARYGGALKNGTNFRMYAKRDNYELTEHTNGTAASDAWHKTQAGFRADMGSAADGVTIQGDAYDGDLDPTQPDTQQISGSNLLARWSGTTAAGSHRTVRFYYDGTHRHAPGIYDEQLSIFDLLVQQDTRISENNNVIAGAGYRFGHDHMVNGNALTFLPEREDLRWASLFAQDDVTLSEKARATLGLRAEYNMYTHWELLPNLRLSYALNKESVIWGAISRSVRAPSRIDRDLYAPPNPPYLLAGGPEFGSEVANTMELGFRAQATTSFSYSLTAFYERFRRLRSVAIANNTIVFNNGTDGHTFGIEGWMTYRVNRAWRVDAGFLRMRKNYSVQPGSFPDTTSLVDDPKYQWQARSTVDVSPKIDLSLSVRHVSALPDPVLPSYTAVDMQAGYKLQKGVRFSLSVLNAQGGKHQEFTTTSTQGSEFGREIYLGLSVEI